MTRGRPALMRRNLLRCLSARPLSRGMCAGTRAEDARHATCPIGVAVQYIKMAPMIEPVVQYESA